MPLIMPLLCLLPCHFAIDADASDTLMPPLRHYAIAIIFAMLILLPPLPC